MRGIDYRVNGQSWRAALRDAVVIAALCAAVGIAVNAVRTDGITLVQQEPYQILVPCPESMGEAEGVSPEQLDLANAKLLLIDARSKAQFAQWHANRALSVPFDYLESVNEAHVRRVASSGAQEVLVYGDGADPDSGEQLARELSSKGIRNVRFVRGGAPVLQSPGGQP